MTEIKVVDDEAFKQNIVIWESKGHEILSCIAEIKFKNSAGMTIAVSDYGTGALLVAKSMDKPYKGYRSALMALGVKIDSAHVTCREKAV